MAWVKFAEKANGKTKSKYWMNVNSSGHRKGQKVGTKAFSTTTLRVCKSRPKTSLKYDSKRGVYKEK